MKRAFDDPDELRENAEILSRMSADGSRPFTLSAACNGCGACCDPITLSHDPQGIREMTDETVVDPDFRRWMQTALLPLPREVGIARAEAHGRNAQGWENFYECIHYDRETRRCLDWENRPKVCRGYPHYWQEPDPAKVLPPACSYLEDTGRVPVPVEIVRRRAE
jgi:Fe-S-cluster containining protein